MIQGVHVGLVHYSFQGYANWLDKVKEEADEDSVRVYDNMKVEYTVTMKVSPKGFPSVYEFIVSPINVSQGEVWRSTAGKRFQTFKFLTDQIDMDDLNYLMSRLRSH